MGHCIVCGKENFKNIYSDTLLKCLYCGFVTANIDLTLTDFNKIYSENYFKGEEYLNYIEDKKIIQKNFKNRLNFIKKNIKNKLITNCFEIGCAYGFFGETLKNKITTKYTGIDISKDAVEYGKNHIKLDLTVGDYINLEPPDNPYSDVFMWDVIEHLKAPDKYIMKIAQETKKGSRLYITTGDIDSLLAKQKKEKWRLIHPPTHLHYFSKKTIKIFLKKYGFRIMKITYPAIYRSLRQIIYSLFFLSSNNNRLSKWIPETLSIPINTFDIMFVIAEKL